ncbi:MAG TPA: ISAs1 family transposase [Candidatus Angelobacter sp.]|nr:ISAs1 family transposase [Candidatus Angelobacter sp.]
MDPAFVKPRTRSLLQHLSVLKDPRQPCKVMYPLPEVLLLVVCATMAGCDDYDEIAAWGEARLAFLRRFRPYHWGVPCEDWLRVVMNRIDPDLFAACFRAWAAELSPGSEALIAIDGKTSRRTHDRRRGQPALHLVSAWATSQRLVLGQEAVADKSNEITAIPRLLEHLTLKGALVTIDAMGTQVNIAQTILEGGGNYLLALKANHPLVFKDIETFFTAPPPDLIVDTHETTDGEHGRIEVRRHAVCHDVAWLFSDRRYPGEPVFPGLAMIGMVASHTQRDGKTEHERRYYLSSARLDAETFATSVRAHWGIENRLHWVLDVVFKEDLSRLRRGHGARNMAIVRHFAINLLRKPDDRRSLKTRRKLAGWDPDYMHSILTPASR